MKTKNLMWADLDPSQLQALEQATSLNAIHSLLAQFLQGTTSSKNDPNGSILLKLYSNALLFAKQLHFTAEKTSTFFSILKLVHFRSLQYPSLGLEDNFNFFKNLLVDHSIQRPPYSVQIFSLEDVKSITDYVTHTYFRHFKLYRWQIYLYIYSLFSFSYLHKITREKKQLSIYSTIYTIIWVTI